MKKLQVDQNEFEYQLEFMTDDLLMISIESLKGYKEILSYWRAKKTNAIPPLEIGINCKNGLLMRIVLFVDMAKLTEVRKITNERKNGNIVFKTDVFIISK